MLKILGKLFNFLVTILIILLLTVAVLLVGVRAVGIQPFIVLSGSMEPAYPTGSVVYVKSIDTSELEVGDAITFNLAGGGTATHRIIEIVPNENGDPSYRTQGDANENPDASLVKAQDVIGKAIFHIPHLGYWVDYVKNPPGIYIAIALSATVMLGALLLELFSESDKKEKEYEDKK